MYSLTPGRDVCPTRFYRIDKKMRKYSKYLSVLLAVACLLMVGFACSSSEDDKQKDEPTTEDPINTFFKDEVRPPVSQSCFAGAYYRKVVSSKDLWLGIGGSVVLPTIEFDADRANPSKPGQYLDNPSVYLGGSMGGQETDIGLTWEVVKENGVVSSERKAFRPFMRRTSHAGGQSSNYSNAPAEDRYYWYPGEIVTISVEVLEAGKVHFVVDGNGKHYETDYECDGYKPGYRGEFKRVNAIDQVANEGKPVQATKTRVKGAVWQESYLFREYEGKVVKCPIHDVRFTDMRCPETKYFDIQASDSERDRGGETITIDGAGL